MPRKRTAPPVRAERTTNAERPAEITAERPAEITAERPGEITVEQQGREIHFAVDDRRYRVRGLESNLGGQQLRVNLLATRDGLVHMDTLDLCQARGRGSFVKAAAMELFVDEARIKRDVGRMLLELERLQQERIRAATAPTQEKVEPSAAERADAMTLLNDPRLVDRLLADYQTCGLVGEEVNKLVCYLACVSRHLDRPLAVLIQSGSAAGKTSLMDATLAFVPPEDQLRYSAMTGQSLYYMGRRDLKHKILAVAEEEGVLQASYALKLLQSDGGLRIAAAGKNGQTGRQQTDSYEIEGPVMMFLTTTSPRPDAELQNRCLTLRVDESSEQTEAIHARQRAAYTLDGRRAEGARQRILRRHRNAQRLLEPLPVTIPGADRLRFRHDQTRMRRDHAKYLALIAASALLHQHQRPRQTHTLDGEDVVYLEADRRDVALANRLMSHLMGRSLDALLPQTRQLLERLDAHVRRRQRDEPRSSIRFTQRELREQLGWGDYALRCHLARLVELEYVLAHRTGHGNQRHYELLYDGQGRRGEPFLLGLADPDELVAPPQDE